jgi:hypothetical protein
LPRDRTVYRFLHSPASDDRDFTPIAFRGGDAPRQGARCDHFALSFFESLELARKRYRSLAARLDAESRYGSHIGRLELVSADGRVSEPGRDGHMALHPEAEARFAYRVSEYYSAMDHE